MAAHRICSIPGCGKKHLARGYCTAHWHRLNRYGDPLAGGAPRGEATRYFEDVVLTYDGTDCLIWPFALNEHGYAVLGRRGLVTRLICRRIHGNPPTVDYQAAHSCGRGRFGCVAKRHLSWKTRKENEADKLIHGTRYRGEQAPGNKLTEAQVREIRLLYGTVKQRVLARRYGVVDQTIKDIADRVNWAWLPD